MGKVDDEMNPVLESMFSSSVLLGLAPTEKPVKCRHWEGHPHLLVVTGQNATGKSILRRALTAHARRSGVEVMDLSPEAKARGGIAGLMIYGTEEDCSTGANSARTIRKATMTSRARSSPHMLVFDEPDAGLSDEFAAGAGAELAEFCGSMSPHVSLVVVISHRVALVSSLLSLKPSHLSLDSDMSLQQWVGRTIVPRPLSELLRADKDMYGAVASARHAASQGS